MRELRKWLAAMTSEMNSLIENETWELTPLPNGRKALRSKWIYKIKMLDGKLERFKARLVARGYMQREGIDYRETYSPVASLNTIRLVLSEAFLRYYTIDHLDIKTAYLYGDLDEEVYLKQPKGFTQQGRENLVLRLRKSLYGLKQAGRQWYFKLVEFLKENGFKRCMKDKCVFKKETDDYTMVIVVYVDDLILVTNSEKQRTAFKDTVATRFKMRDLGPVAQLLGIKIERTKDTLKLSQPHFIKKLLEATRMTNCKTKPVPLPESMVANLHKDEESEETNYPYRKVLGSLIFLSNATRPDLSYSVSILGRYGQRPTEMHTRAIKHVLRYLAHTPDLGITYYRNNRDPLF